MENRGKCANLSLDYATGNIIATFILSPENKANIAQEWAYLEGKDLDIIAKPHRERRSLSANAYFHALCGQIADAMSEPPALVKNILIGRYGCEEVDEDGKAYTIKSNLPADRMLLQESLHLKPIGTTREGEQELYWYRVYRPTHTYDTAEFSKLLDGTIYEAQQYGIKIIASKELQRMLERWKPSEKCV